MPKAIVLILWALIVANLLIALPAVMVAPLKWLGITLIVAHIAEFFLFQKEIKAKGDGLGKSLLMTLVFGVVYIKQR